MFPWTPPLWLTMAFVATAIAINLMTIVSKKAITKRLNGKQNNEPYTKNTAYWTHAISSRIAIVVNSIAAIVGTPLLLTGIAWLGSKSPHIFFITMCALIWIASLFFTQVFLSTRNRKTAMRKKTTHSLTRTTDMLSTPISDGYYSTLSSMPSYG